MHRSAKDIKKRVLGDRDDYLRHAIGGFSHVVAGSTDAWLLWLFGSVGPGKAIAGFILSALIGNFLGGTGLFAVIAHG